MKKAESVCVVYARYPYRPEGPRSIDEQLRTSGEFAAEHGWRAADDHPAKRSTSGGMDGQTR